MAFPSYYPHFYHTHCAISAHSLPSSITFLCGCLCASEVAHPPAHTPHRRSPPLTRGRAPAAGRTGVSGWTSRRSGLLAGTLRWRRGMADAATPRRIALRAALFRARGISLPRLGRRGGGRTPRAPPAPQKVGRGGTRPRMPKASGHVLTFILKQGSKSRTWWGLTPSCSAPCSPTPAPDHHEHLTQFCILGYQHIVLT